MADKLTIRINAEGGTRTLSKFEVAVAAPVAIHNDSSAQLNVKFAGTSPLCSGTSPQLTFNISAGQKRDFKVCNDTAGLSYRYIATVSGATAENQVLVVPRGTGPGTSPNPIFFPETWIAFVAGVIITWSVFYFIGRKKLTRTQR